MKKLFLVGFLTAFCMISGFAQISQKTDKSLDPTMEKFIGSISRKNTTAFLSYISRAKGLTIMNTIDQGEAGNADKPMFVETLKYAALVADFKKKGGNYQDIFVKSQEDPNFYDNFFSLKTKWKNAGNNVFMPADKQTGETIKTNYVKWEKEGGRWVVIEVGRMIS